MRNTQEYQEWDKEQEAKWEAKIEREGIALPEDGTTQGWDEVVGVRGETWALASWVIGQADEDGWDADGLHAGIDIDMEGWARDRYEGTSIEGRIWEAGMSKLEQIRTATKIASEALLTLEAWMAMEDEATVRETLDNWEDRDTSVDIGYAIEHTVGDEEWAEIDEDEQDEIREMAGDAYGRAVGALAGAWAE